MIMLKSLRGCAWWLCLCFLPVHAVALSLHVAVEYPKAPGCSAFAEKSKAVMEEWYPKINDILFGSAHPLPAESITLVCEPMQVIAYSDIEKNRIHISSAFVAAHPLDYGTVVHELTHIVQHYAKLKREGVWLQEGIADYIRHQYTSRIWRRWCLRSIPIMIPTAKAIASRQRSLAGCRSKIHRL